MHVRGSGGREIDEKSPQQQQPVTPQQQQQALSVEQRQQSPGKFSFVYLNTLKC